MIEHRTFTSEIRAEDPKNDGSIAKIGGYAALFNTRSELLGGFFFEEIAPGAFDGVMGDDVRGLYDHDSGVVLGRKSAETLDFSVDEKGLKYEIDLPDTQAGRDLLTSIKRGDIRESSFGFIIARRGAEWDVDEEGREVRTITKLQRLLDVSPVAFPAYSDTDVGLRSLKESDRAQGIAVPEKRKDDPHKFELLDAEDDITLRALIETLLTKIDPDTKEIEARILESVDQRVSEAVAKLEESNEKTERRINALMRAYEGLKSRAA